MRFTLIISLILSIFAVIFALQNPQTTEVQVGTLVFQGSTALVLLVTFALGVVVGLLGAMPGWIRNRRKVSSLRKTIAEGQVSASSSKSRTTSSETASPASTQHAPPEPSPAVPPEEKKSSSSSDADKPARFE